MTWRGAREQWWDSLARWEGGSAHDSFPQGLLMDAGVFPCLASPMPQAVLADPAAPSLSQGSPHFSFQANVGKGVSYDLAFGPSSFPHTGWCTSSSCHGCFALGTREEL